MLVRKLCLSQTFTVSQEHSMPVKGEKCFSIPWSLVATTQVYLPHKIMRCPMKKLRSVDSLLDRHLLRPHRRTWSRENELYGVSFKQKREGGYHSRPINKLCLWKLPSEQFLVICCTTFIF